MGSHPRPLELTAASPSRTEGFWSPMMMVCQLNVHFHAVVLNSCRRFLSWTLPSLGPWPMQLTFWVSRNHSSGGQIEIKEQDVKLDTPLGIDNCMNLRVSQDKKQKEIREHNKEFVRQSQCRRSWLFYAKCCQDGHTESPISLVQAILGGTVNAKTPWCMGHVKMKVSKICQWTRKVLQLKGVQWLPDTCLWRKSIARIKIQIRKFIAREQWRGERKWYSTGILRIEGNRICIWPNCWIQEKKEKRQQRKKQERVQGGCWWQTRTWGKSISMSHGFHLLLTF